MTHCLQDRSPGRWCQKDSRELRSISQDLHWALPKPWPEPLRPSHFSGTTELGRILSGVCRQWEGTVPAGCNSGWGDWTPGTPGQGRKHQNVLRPAGSGGTGSLTRHPLDSASSSLVKFCSLYGVSGGLVTFPGLTQRELVPKSTLPAPSHSTGSQDFVHWPREAPSLPRSPRPQHPCPSPGLELK